jgi:glycosyltransferase involved in cell wall biosynthesis
MTKKKSQKKIMPLVSVCTPTFNRRPFIPIMFECFRNQTYPKDRIEWIIIDDGTDKIQDLVECANIPQIKYFQIDKKMTLGAKRNLMHEKSTGSILVYMDDDDYYPPERIQHAVEKLQEKKEVLIAGSSELYIYFKHIQKMYQAGPYNQNHATAGTFAFKREILSLTKYNENAALAEEAEFLKQYSFPMVQLDPLKTILVFSHIHNTFDKKQMLENPHPDFMKESNKTIDMFIKYKDEDKIKKFFLKDIDRLLENYKPGEPMMKPDVLVQIKEITEKRQQMMSSQNESHIMMQLPGKDPVKLDIQEAANIINSMQQQGQELIRKNQELENIVSQLQKQLVKYQMQINSASNTTCNNNVDKVETDAEIVKLRDENIKFSQQLLKYNNNEYLLNTEIQELKNKISKLESSNNQIKPQETTFIEIIPTKSKLEPEVKVAI